MIIIRIDDESSENAILSIRYSVETIISYLFFLAFPAGILYHGGRGLPWWVNAGFIGIIAYVPLRFFPGARTIEKNLFISAISDYCEIQWLE
jgi:hypothetical protein